ncbi:MAG: hypothetical protein LR120_09110 [Dehalococcoidia bacterium]|nr:hypothetical protein [Dehalococcoidia bacterium]
MACGLIAATSAIQNETWSPNFPIQEAKLGPLHAANFNEPLAFENSSVTSPTAPGLDVEFGEDVLRALMVE